MNIRYINKNDVSALTELILNYRLEQNQNFNNKRKDIIHILMTLVNRIGTITLVALNKKEKIIGFINCHEILFPMIGGKEIYISDLVIDKNERGKGVGKKLIAEIDKIAKKGKFKRLMLNNSKESECYYRGFYKNLGFEERDNFSNFVKNY